MAKKNPAQSSPDGSKVIAEVLKACGPRPAYNSAVSIKIDYAVRFADQMAQRIATSLGGRFKGISATTKRTAGSMGGKTKQLDINFSTPRVGLALGVSLKSVHTRDHLKKTNSAGRYTHNMKRNEEELRVEASGYHKRQPYAVMIGVLLLPIDSCDDGKAGASSFGAWVRHLRPYTGRDEANDDIDKFEQIYVALYDPKASTLGFFDTSWAPPKNGRPVRLLTYAEFLDTVYHEYLRRNGSEFTWASGEEEPLDLDEDGEDEDHA